MSKSGPSPSRPIRRFEGLKGVLHVLVIQNRVVCAVLCVSIARGAAAFGHDSGSRMSGTGSQAGFPAERLHMQNVLRMHVGYAHQARALTVCAAPSSHRQLRMSNRITVAQ